MLQHKWTHSYYSDSASSVYNIKGSVFSVVLKAEKEKKSGNMLHNNLDKNQSFCYMLLYDFLKPFCFKYYFDYSV